MKDILVILDNGHGKDTPGKRSPELEDGRQLLEWSWCREVVRRIAARLDKEDIANHILVPGDEDTGLTKRANAANKVTGVMTTDGIRGGDGRILISVHGNAAGNGGWMNGRGWEVFTTKGTTNSDKLATCFEEAFKEMYGGRMKFRGKKEEDFTILVKTNCPCVLTENFFYDNKEDCEYMLSEGGMDEIADLHVNAIKKYIKMLG